MGGVVLILAKSRNSRKIDTNLKPKTLWQRKQPFLKQPRGQAATTLVLLRGLACRRLEESDTMPPRVAISKLQRQTQRPMPIRVGRPVFAQEVLHGTANAARLLASVGAVKFQRAIPQSICLPSLCWEKYSTKSDWEFPTRN